MMNLEELPDVRGGMKPLEGIRLRQIPGMVESWKAMFPSFKGIQDNFLPLILSSPGFL